MYSRKILFKFVSFVVFFTIVFFAIQIFNLLPPAKLQQNINSIPWLFSAISLIFSIICGFVIQSRWDTWDDLIDATSGELSSFRQLFIAAHHFPKDTKNEIRKQIAQYLKLAINQIQTEAGFDVRSSRFDDAFYALEDTIFTASKDHPIGGARCTSILHDCMNYREQRLQTNAHKLPFGVKVFIIGATISIIFTSLFIGVDSILYNYIFTLIIGILSFGLYVLIDDLDHPFSPGDWHLKIDGYENLLKEIEKKTLNSDNTPG